MPCCFRRGEREIGRRSQPQNLGNIGHERAATSRKTTTCCLNRIETYLRNQPIQNPLITLRSYKDASGLLPYSVGRQPCCAAFQKLFRMQLEPPLDVLILEQIKR